MADRKRVPVDENDPVIRALRALVKKVGSESALSLKAGLARAHVSLILSGGQGTDLARSTIQKLAKAGGVPVEFFGASAPERFAEVDDRYSTRPQAVIILRGKGYPEWALEALGVEAYKSPSDPGLEHWLTRGQEIAETGGKIPSWDNPAFDRKPDMSELEKRKVRGGK